MKKILAVLSLAFVALIAQAQDISSVVLSMPDDLILKIDEEQKRLLLDNFSDTTKVVVQNMLNEDVRREALSDDYIAVKTSDIGMLQIKLLPLINDSRIIAVIRTVCDNVCDSQLDFFTTSWHPINKTDLFPEITKNLFIKKGVDLNSDDFKNAYAALSMTPIKLVFSTKDQTITAVYDIQKYLAGDDYKLIEPFLEKDPIVFSWDKNSYK